MGRFARLRAVALAVAAAACAACGDPVVVIGDQLAVMRIVAGIADTAAPRVDTLATATALVAPRAVTIGADGVLYIGARERVVSVTSTGRLEILADGSRCSGGACLVRVEGLALTGEGRLIVADGGGHRLYELELATRELRVIAGTGLQSFTPDGEPAATASLAGPSGVLVASDGRILFSERGAQRIRSIEPDGTLATIVGPADEGQAVAAPLASPAGIALAGSVLYIADGGANRVFAVDLATGIVETVAGTRDFGFWGDGGPARLAQLNAPAGVAVSPDGRTLYISDTRNNRVRAVDLAHGTITTFAGTGSDEFTGNGRPAGETALSSPTGLATSPHGLLFIADTGHGLVWRTPVR